MGIQEKGRVEIGIQERGGFIGFIGVWWIHWNTRGDKTWEYRRGGRDMNTGEGGEI